MSDKLEKETPAVFESNRTEQLTLQSTRSRTQSAITNALCDEESVVIGSPPNTGKSTGAAIALAETGIPAFYGILTKENRETFGEKCEEQGLNVLYLPNIREHCQTYPEFEGDEPTSKERESWSNGQRFIFDVHQRGMSPSEIHQRGICSLGEYCNYELKKPDLDGDEGNKYVPQRVAEVLIGDPRHAYVFPYVNQRAVILDDIKTESFVSEYEPTTAKLNAILSDDEFPLSSKSELTSVKGEENGEATDGLADLTISPWSDNTTVKEAELIVETFLKAESLGNGYYSMKTARNNILIDCVIDLEDHVHILRRLPLLNGPKNTVILDGTPVEYAGSPIWYQWSLGLSDLEINPVLSEDERAEFYRDVWGMRVIQTSEWIHPVSGRGTAKITWTDRERLQRIITRWGVPDGTISSMKAIRHLKSEPLPFGEMLNSARVASNNDFGEFELGLVWGSWNYSDEYVKRLAALMGVGTESEGTGTSKEFVDVGDSEGVGQAFYENMVYGGTEQAICRFGRESDVQPTVIADTAAIPEYMPVEKHIITGQTSSDPVLWYLEGLGQFNEAIGETRALATTQIIDAIQSKYDYDASTIRKRLQTLEADGTVEKTSLAGRGAPVAWVLASV